MERGQYSVNWSGKRSTQKARLRQSLYFGVNDKYAFSRSYYVRSKSFIEAREYSVEHNILHQGNASTLRLLINEEKASTMKYPSGKKHIKAFFSQKQI